MGLKALRAATGADPRRRSSLTVIRDAWPRRLGAAVRTALLPLALLSLAACSSNYNLGVSPSLGIGLNVALAVASGTTQLQQGTSSIVIATVSNDVKNAGVTWSLLGPGSLSNATTTTVIYVAPASGVTGAVSAQITATSIADATNTATVTMVTLGTPVLNSITRFPANVSVPYETDLSVAGGTSPFAWALASGTLPPGLTLNNSGTAIASITGTPTAEGSYDFQVEVADGNGNVAGPLPITLVVNPQAACLLSGQFVFTFSGYRGGAAATHTGSITIDSAGAIIGVQDYKDGNRTTVAETLNSTSKCTNRSTNSGVLHLIAPSGELDYAFSTTAPDANNVIHGARLQLINSGEDSGSGQLTMVDSTALTGTPPSGDFAFGLLGVDSKGQHYGTAGRLSSDSSGNISAGLLDSNGGANAALAAAQSDATVVGTLSAPDANGRGTATLQVGSSSSTLAYYIVNAGKLLLMNIDPAVGSARESGFMTAQTGNVSAATFDASALASPAILSLWGRISTLDPSAVVSLGRLSAADPGTGTVDVVLDTANQANDTANVNYPAQSYTVDSSGRGTLTLSGGGATRSFVFYLDGAANGYIVEPGSTAGSAGLLEAQAVGPLQAQSVPPGSFPDTLAGEFVAGTQYPQTQGPVSLLPLVQLAYGAISSNFYQGTFAIDPTTGRGFGTVIQQGLPETADVVYEVSPTKLDVMNFATPNGTNASIMWLVQ
jgi:hypothetical protein